MSGKFETIALDAIQVNPDRQRRELTGIDELASSIAQNGLIHPPLLDGDNVLIAGERRLTAMRQLGWTHTVVQRRDGLSIVEKELLELDENVKRNDLDWRDECRAIHRYAGLRAQVDAEISDEDVALELGISRSKLSQRRAVARALEEGDPDVTAAERFSVARGILERRAQRAEASIADVSLSSLFTPGGAGASVVAALGKPASPEKLGGGGKATVPGATVPTAKKPAHAPADEATPETAPAPEPIPLYNKTFQWLAAQPSTVKFNLLHCDFPYGINADKHDAGASGAFGGYEDTPEVYWQLIEVLADFTQSHVSESAHMIFWFSMTYYEETREALSQMGWKVNPMPLIWGKSDNRGALPDPKRGPRQVYETAFLCTRGDRYIVSAKANLSFVPSTKTIHMSEKSFDMLTHFLTMLVDDTTVMLDPTAGSGMAVRVAESLGARVVVGLEKDKTFHDLATAAYAEWRAKKGA